MSRRVLVVEDNGALRFALRVMIEAETGIDEVETVPTGERALALVPDLDPDIVVTDHGLPGIQGEELAGRIRELCPHAHIISFSGSDALTPWADVRIVKGTPTAIEDLRAAVGRSPTRVAS